MKKLFIAFSLLLSLLLTASSVLAQAGLKTVTLADGTKIKGTIVNLTDGVYTIQTTNLGKLSVKDSEVVSITAGNVDVATPQADKGVDLKNQVNQMQNTLMSDPQVMQDIQQLMNDPEVMKLLADKNFVNDMMSYDPNRIEGNEKTKQLMENPKIKAIMDKVSQKYSTTAPTQQ